MMFPQDFRSWLVYIVITIILAVLGSACWEGIFRPVSVRAGRLFLKVATFGLSSARDGMYKDISGRNIAKPIMTLLLLLCFASFAALGMAASDYQKTHFDGPSYTSEARFDEHIKSLSIQQLEAEKRAGDRSLYLLRGQLASMKLYVVLIFCFFISISYIKHKYILSAIRYFDQLMEICGPVLSAKERLMLRSRFARVQSSRDYRSLIGDLLSVASSIADVVVPKFLVL
jgi:hypothetical protein